MNWGLGEVYWLKGAEVALADQTKSETIRQTKELQAWLEDRIEPSGLAVGT